MGAPGTNSSAFSYLCLNCPSSLATVQETARVQSRVERLTPAGAGQVLLQHWFMAEPNQCLCEISHGW